MDIRPLALAFVVLSGMVASCKAANKTDGEYVGTFILGFTTIFCTIICSVAMFSNAR